jgi:hypothetical protein
MSASPDGSEASGPDPMDPPPTRADEPHAMSTTLRYSQYDLLDELVARAAGRFGRQIRTIAWPNPELAPVRTMEVERMKQRLKSGYEVDPRLVASAIIDRLAAGGLTAPVRKPSA